MIKKVFTSILEIRKKYRSFKKKNKTYRVFRYSLTALLALYGLLLAFPQILFAHQANYSNLDVYAREEIDQKAIIEVLRSAESRLVKSPIYDQNSKQKIFIASSHGMYKFLKFEGRSFASTIPVIQNIKVNRSDIKNDLVLRDTEAPNRRSLSGVIAHEITHNQISSRYGLATYLRIPVWKDEGYCEYVAGETTLSFDEGVRLWKEVPNDDSKYAYFKYHQMVKYLLEDEKISVEDMFQKYIDPKQLEAKVFKKLCQS